jgi:hypothetical protein
VNRHLLERASRMFNSVADLRTEEDQRINEWFKERLATSAQCVRCGKPEGDDIHYVGTVDSHPFEAQP